MPDALMSRSKRHGLPRNRGFSLIELAIGLVIVATLLSALLVPLATQMDQRRVSETQKQLEMARDALIGYAISAGRLPCPATATSNGVEKFVEPLGSAVSGECQSMNGFLPAVTLGLSPLDGNGYYRDAYGTASNRIRYAVSTSNTTFWNSTTCSSPGATASLRALTRVNGMKGDGIMRTVTQTAECAQVFLRVCTTANCSGTGNQVLSNGGAAAVVWSVGRNAADTARTIPADELENLDLDDDRDFVARERRDTTGNEFDDIVLWISPSVLMARMAAAGALP